jgi:raffinose/stachyose/melibiose transport system substrate-binding protein
MKKRLTGLLATAVVMALAGCSGSSGSGGADAASPTDPSKVSGDITVLTNRTDLVDNGTMAKYAAEFSKTYSKVHVKFQGITDYENEVKIRMNSKNYGDVLLIPSVSLVKIGDYPKFFASLGTSDDLTKKYRYIPNGTYNGKVYGVAQNGNANGFVYNKTVWQQAGITQWPTTPAEFITDLQAIKSKTSATPYYTNYHDGWPLSTWESAVGSVSCDPKANDNLATTNSPWTSGSDLYTIDSLIYTMAHDKLIESDPTTTSWEPSKALIGTGKVATMWLGSWAVSQMQAAAKTAGADPASIGFMPFPAQVGGHFCSISAPDYLQGVSLHSAHKAAARAWLDWFTDKSTYSEDQGSVPTLRSAAFPATVKPYQDAKVQFVELTQDKAATVSAIDNAAEVGLTKPDYRQKIVDTARGAASGSLDGIFADLNKKWAAGIKTVGS